MTLYILHYLLKISIYLEYLWTKCPLKGDDMLTKSLPPIQTAQTELVLEPELTKLASDSAKELGYSELSQQIKIKTKQTGGDIAFAKLSEALRGLEIEVFCKEEVFGYMQQKLKEVASGERRPMRWLLIPLFCLVICLSLAPILPDKSEVESICIFVAVFSGLLLFVGAPVTFGIYGNNANLWEWQKVNLKDYKKPIPEFVLRKALQIKEKCPGVTFFVYELIKRERQINGDPFLAVCCGNDGYFVEVWDEPKFETKL